VLDRPIGKPASPGAELEPLWVEPAIVGLGYRFADPELEHQFMESVTGENRRRLLLVIGAMMAISMLNIGLDLFFYIGHPDLYLRFLPARFLVLSIGVIALGVAERTTTARQVEWLAILVSLVWTTARLVALFAHDPAVTSGSAMIIGSVVLMYFGLPIGFMRQVPLMIFYSVALLAGYLLAHPGNIGQTASDAIWLMVLHLVGISALRTMRRTLRRAYAQGLAFEHLAHHDSLTGLANRRQFEVSLQSEWSRAGRDARPLSLIMLDIDHFKIFNDSQGHTAGDLCLRKIGGILLASAQRTEDLAARIGGEEFALLLPGTPADAARAIAQKLLQSVLDAGIPHASSPVAPQVTVSLGVATVALIAGHGHDDLTELADQLLYAAKHAGRNRISCGSLGQALV